MAGLGHTAICGTAGMWSQQWHHGTPLASVPTTRKPGAEQASNSSVKEGSRLEGNGGYKVEVTFSPQMATSLKAKSLWMKVTQGRLAGC